MKQIQKWKDETLAHWTAGIVRCAKEREELITDFGRNAFLFNKNGCASEWLEKYPTVYRKHVYNVHGEELNETAIKELKKLIDERFRVLQAKVEKKIGTITEIQHWGGADYSFKGSEGSCTVEVIGAGGYNVQCYHTRWIIKK